MKNFTSVNDIVEDPSGDKNIEINKLIDQARSYQSNPLQDCELGKGKTLGLIFFNPSLRTRMSTIKAAQSLGLNVISMNTGQDSWVLETAEGVIMDEGSAEHIKEAAGVMGSYCDILGVRSFPELKDQQEDYKEIILNSFIKYSGVPIISLESATRHPLQSLTDLLTIETNKKKKQPKVVLTWAPHVKALPQAVANSFAEWVNEMPYDFVISQPLGFELDSSFTGNAKVTNNQEEALKKADFVYVKNWSAYHNYGAIGDFRNWQITADKMKLTNNAKLMHCLPVRRNLVISDEVLDSDTSLVIEQAGNRVYAAQAVLKSLLTSS